MSKSKLDPPGICQAPPFDPCSLEPYLTVVVLRTSCMHKTPHYRWEEPARGVDVGVTNHPFSGGTWIKARSPSRILRTPSVHPTMRFFPGVKLNGRPAT